MLILSSLLLVTSQGASKQITKAGKGTLPDSLTLTLSMLKSTVKLVWYKYVLVTDHEKYVDRARANRTTKIQNCLTAQWCVSTIQWTPSRVTFPKKPLSCFLKDDSSQREFSCSLALEPVLSKDLLVLTIPLPSCCDIFLNLEKH